MSPGLPRRRFGRTGMTPVALGLGCAFFGGDRSSDADTVDGVRRAIDLGLDYVDTSPGYGQSERRLGLALADGWRERVYLETKVGTHPEHRGDYSAATTRWSMDFTDATARSVLELSGRSGSGSGSGAAASGPAAELQSTAP